MQLREFVTWDEASRMLATADTPIDHPRLPPRDQESLRQAVILKGCPAFLELVDDAFIGRVFWDLESGNTRYARWDALPFENDGGGCGFELEGWFQLDSGDAGRVCRGVERLELFNLTPANDGEEVPFFVVSRIELAREALWFRRSDVEAMKAGSLGQTEAQPRKIRSDREENLLRVIAGLWALSGLPSEHNTTADKLSALFDGWGWDKPAKSSIADTILKQAANLPGAGIRTSD